MSPKLFKQVFEAHKLL